MEHLNFNSLKYLNTDPASVLQIFPQVLVGRCQDVECSLACEPSVLTSGEVGTWPILKGHGLFWAALRVSLMTEWHLLAILSSVSSAGTQVLVCKFPGGVFLLFSYLFQPQSLPTSRKTSLGSDGVEENAVPGRLHPTWLCGVVKHKYFPVRI